jgi:hypothetical protein
MTNGHLLLSFVYQQLKKQNFKINQLVLLWPHHTTRKVRKVAQPTIVAAAFAESPF